MNRDRPTGPVKVLEELLHELRSPLSLVLIRAETSGDRQLERMATRMEWLLRYAAGAASERPLQGTAMPIGPEVLAASRMLSAVWEPVNVEGLGCLTTVSAVMPAEEDLRMVMLAGWLESCLYGAADRTVNLAGRLEAGHVIVEASARAGGAREPDKVRSRLCTRAAGRLAAAVGGRLVVGGSSPRTALVLPRAVAETNKAAEIRAA